MLVVGMTALRLREPLRMRMSCVADGLISTSELLDFLESERATLRRTLTQQLQVSAFDSAIIVSAAEAIVLHGQMRRSADQSGMQIEQVEFRWLRDEARRIAREFAADQDTIAEILGDILTQYTTQKWDRPAPTPAYSRIDRDLPVPPAMVASF